MCRFGQAPPNNSSVPLPGDSASKDVAKVNDYSEQCNDKPAAGRNSSDLDMANDGNLRESS